MIVTCNCHSKHCTAGHAQSDDALPNFPIWLQDHEAAQARLQELADLVAELETAYERWEALADIAGD